MTAVIEAKNLKAYYITNAYGVERTVKAVDDISMQINEGEIYGIAGESGELVEMFKKILFHDKPLDKEKVVKEYIQHPERFGVQILYVNDTPRDTIVTYLK